MGFVLAACLVAFIAGAVGAGAVLYAEFRSLGKLELSMRLVLCALQGYIGLGGAGGTGIF